MGESLLLDSPVHNYLVLMLVMQSWPQWFVNNASLDLGILATRDNY